MKIIFYLNFSIILARIIWCSFVSISASVLWENELKFIRVGEFEFSNLPTINDCCPLCHSLDSTFDLFHFYFWKIKMLNVQTNMSNEMLWIYVNEIITERKMTATATEKKVTLMCVKNCKYWFIEAFTRRSHQSKLSFLDKTFDFRTKRKQKWSLERNSSWTVSWVSFCCFDKYWHFNLRYLWCI